MIAVREIIVANAIRPCSFAGFRNRRAEQVPPVLAQTFFVSRALTSLFTCERSA